MSSSHPVLHTSRLTLRPTLLDDEAGIAAAGRDAGIRDLPWFGAAFRDSWAAEWVRRADMEWKAGRNRTFSILDGQSAYVGSVNLGVLRDGAIEVAYWVVPGHRGRGIATEALRAVIDWARAAFPGVRFWAKTRLDNFASQQVLLKSGFRETSRSDVARFDCDS